MQASTYTLLLYSIYLRLKESVINDNTLYLTSKADQSKPLRSNSLIVILYLSHIITNFFYLQVQFILGSNTFISKEFWIDQRSTRTILQVAMILDKPNKLYIIFYLSYLYVKFRLIYWSDISKTVFWFNGNRMIDLSR